MLGNIGTFGMMTDAFGAILTNSVLLEHVMRICSVWFPISTTILFQIMWAPVSIRYLSSSYHADFVFNSMCVCVV